MGLRSSPSSNAMAESRIIRNVLRCWITSDSGEVFAMVIGKSGGSPPLLDDSCIMLLLKVVGWMLLFCCFDGEFMMVVDKSFKSGRKCFCEMIYCKLHSTIESHGNFLTITSPLRLSAFYHALGTVARSDLLQYHHSLQCNQ
jgi:hypothetical protein